MSILKLPLLYAGTLGEKHLYTLFDSGADFSCIDAAVLDELEKALPLTYPRRIVTASEDNVIEVRERVALDFFINELLLSDEFLVVPNLSEEVIIGANTMQKFRILLDFDRDRVIVDPKVTKHQLIDLKFMPTFIVRSPHGKKV